ncbi:hypothetical protein LX64_03297 [Chitinophaga skermanii]|uniref:Uncharacterized protein n=1 Tax=Chitinophaga skermanii TaxID=331697 RepID=A0A327QEJ2_9BACT|nr:hypothetical protein [Chitinophaga skermanii]RAJ02288.1 hypothetical protein LX64_03297 [Chitinophaga skermanii]
MKKFQTLFILASVCLLFSNIQAANSHPAWDIKQTFFKDAPAKRFSSVSVRINVVGLLGLPINVCSVAGQLLIGTTYAYVDGTVTIPTAVQCYSNEQTPLLLDVSEGSRIVIWGTVLSTGLQASAIKTVTAGDISAGVVTVNLLL